MSLALTVWPQNKVHRRSTRAQNKDIQKCNFHYKTVRRFFIEIAGGHVLSKCPKERHSPPWNIKFSICFQGGDCLSLGHLLRTWRTEKIPYAKLTWSATSVCTSSVTRVTLPRHDSSSKCWRHGPSQCAFERHSPPWTSAILNIIRGVNASQTRTG
jgi:hypothetical protein